MSEQPQGSAQTASDSVAAEKSANDVVKYETYSRVLSEAKKLKDKVKAYEEQLAQTQEQKLKEQNEWKTLAEQYKSKYEETNKVLTEQEARIVNGIKFQEFEKHLGGRLKNSEYAAFVDFEKIVLNPETKRVDEESVKQVASEFVKSHSALIDFSVGKIPNKAATDFQSKGKDIGAMKPDELKEMILDLHKKGIIK